MSRCTCSPMCPRCGDGPCDCTCTKEEVAAYKAKVAADRLAPIEARGAVTDALLQAARNAWIAVEVPEGIDDDGEESFTVHLRHAILAALRARGSAPAVEPSVATGCAGEVTVAQAMDVIRTEMPCACHECMRLKDIFERGLDKAALSQPTRAAGEPMDVGTEYYETLPILEEDGRITCPHHPTWCCLKRAHTSDQCISTGAA
jgi:hypothetical protein